MTSDTTATTAQERPVAVGAPQQGMRVLLLAATKFTAVMTALLVLLSVLVDRQSDILADRSEAHGFDPSVFSPFSDGIWVLTNAVMGLALVAVLGLTVLLITTRRTRR